MDVIFAHNNIKYQIRLPKNSGIISYNALRIGNYQLLGVYDLVVYNEGVGKDRVI